MTSIQSKRKGKAWRLFAASSTLLALMTSTALAQGLLPAGFFDAVPVSQDAPAEIEADVLAYDAASKVVTAKGNVALRYQGYVATADQLIFDQRTGAVTLIGQVRMTDPRGIVYTADVADVSGGLKDAFLRSLTITTPGGGVITAADTEYASALETIMTDTSYAPCGLCVDAKGRKIGWRVRAARMVLNNKTKTVYLEQPVLELLGLPVAWLPFLALPDLTAVQNSGLRMPYWDSSDQTGFMFTVPYFLSLSRDTDLILTPTLVSRQGFLMGAELVQRFDKGVVSVKATGIRQADPEAFAGEVGDTEWRGAIQTAGAFTPLEHWTVGWSYTAFTDSAFLPDYKLTNADDSVTEVYATHLSRDHFFDLRLQRYNIFTTSPDSDAQDKQALALPNARYENVTELGDGNGQLSVSARLLGVRRGADDLASAGGVGYVFGYQGEKLHGSLQMGWQNQWIAPGGLVATPYLGLRGDAARFDGTADPAAAPDLPGDIYTDTPADQTLFSATPIAAMDLRYPLMARNGADVHIVEPIAQMVYRGSDDTLPGITNDNAQSFVFDDTNLFSYDRFSGTDRQETGLRTNLGIRYQANFSDGGWLEVLAGQSFHLAGLNGLGMSDHAHVGTSTGLGEDVSYMVLGAKGSLFGLFTGGGKLLVDPEEWDVARAGLGLRYSNAYGYSFDLDYAYVPADPALGTSPDQHEVGGIAGIPIADYWRMTGGLYWDITSNQWLEATGGLAYDDGYLLFGASYTVTGATHDDPDDHRFTASFRLKGPDGVGLSF